MYLNRTKLIKLLKGQQEPNPPKKVTQPTIPVEEEDETPREVFLSIIKELNEKPKKGQKKVSLEKKKKKAVLKLKEYFADNFPLISEEDENVFD